MVASCLIAVLLQFTGTLIAATAVMTDANTQGLTDDVLRPIK